MIRCMDLGMTYPNGRVALSSVNLSIQSAGIFVLIGRNGSGKTTLVRILSTELKPTAGRAYIDDVDVVEEPDRIRERIAIVPQEARTLNWATPRQTIYSYLLWRGFSGREAKRRTQDVIELLKMDRYADALNRHLSGGMKRKVLVSSVLASEAEIIFLDEPTTGLDPISRKEFWEILRETARQRFVFLTTHYLEEAEELGQNIGILDNSRMVMVGTVEELRSKLRYNFSVRIRKDGRPLPIDGFECMKHDSEEEVRILLREDDAYELSRRLSSARFRYTINPLSLDDIFFYTVGRSADDNGRDENQ